ncbi:hypothetical protein SAY87_029448 [Trapa incisa]|uniref:Cytochrome P450 n=1 Tax=Trapa incisa TaxID=236973 RepID=A0AAN7KB30_9MYRT|nr:hypothetical protein SAY87_029448 [Trapa incisa]
MDTILLWVLCLCLSWGVVNILFYGGRKRGNHTPEWSLPPGPRTLPIIGNLIQLGSLPHRSLTELSKVHGPIMSLKLGRVTTVVISSAHLAREVLQVKDVSFSDRIIPDTITPFDHFKFGLAWMPVGPLWRNQRRICNAHLFGPKPLDSNQQLRRKKIQELVAHVGKCGETRSPVNIGAAAFQTVLSHLSNTILSMDLTGSRSESEEFKEKVWQIMVEAGKPNVVDYFPVLRPLDPQGARRRMMVYAKWLMDLFTGIVDRRLQARRAAGGSESKNDVLDALLNICEDEKEGLDLNQIKHIFLDLFVAGADTTSSTLEWAMAELLHNPDKLLKAQAELHEEIGRVRPIEESDMTRLPYLHAIVKETLRLHPAVPLLLPRRAGVTAVVGGYTVPEGSQVLVNVWAIGRDPATWTRPEEFVPERFMGVQMDYNGQSFELLPFGSGRRICPGMPLATRMLHLMLASLINCFDWELEGGAAPASLEMADVFGLTLKKAPPLRAVPSPRNSS